MDEYLKNYKGISVFDRVEIVDDRGLPKHLKLGSIGIIDAIYRDSDYKDVFFVVYFKECGYSFRHLYPNRFKKVNNLSQDRFNNLILY